MIKKQLTIKTSKVSDVNKVLVNINTVNFVRTVMIRIVLYYLAFPSIIFKQSHQVSYFSLSFSTHYVMTSVLGRCDENHICKL